MHVQHVSQNQDGLITRAQLRGAGVSSARIRRMVAHKDLVEIRPGVYIHSSMRPTQRQMWRAAVLWSNGVLSHRTAAQIWGLGVRRGSTTELTVPRGWSLRVPEGVSVRRRLLDANAVVDADGLPVTTRRRTVIDCLRILTWHEAVELRDRAVRKRWIVEHHLQLELRDTAGHAGVEQLRRLARLAPGTHAESERLLHRLLRRARMVGWEPQVEVEIDDRTWWIDAAFPVQMVAIEIDGRDVHENGPVLVLPGEPDYDPFETDRVKQLDLASLGWTVLRVTWKMMTENPDKVIARIRSTLTNADSGRS